MTAFNLTSAEFTALCLNIGLKGFALLALTLGAVFCMGRNSAATRHLALCLALASLLLLPLLSWTLPRFSVLPNWLSVRSSTPANIGQPVNHPAERFDPITLPKGPAAKATPPSIPLPFNGSFEEPTTLEARWSVSRWFFPIWLTGVLIVLAPTILGLLSLRLLRRRSQTVRSGSLIELLGQVKVALGYEGNITLLTSRDRSMPMVWGVFRPTILLPQQSTEWPEERTRLVLLHELAHIQRHDFLTTLLTSLACALHWFNPLVWIAARQIKCEQEQACDDIVLRAGAAPEDYAEEVLQFAAGRTVPMLESLGAVAMARHSSLEGRLLSILDHTRNRAPLNQARILVASLLALIAIIPMSMLRAAQTATQPDQSGSEATGLNQGLIAWWRGDGDANDSAGKHDGTTPFGARFYPGLKEKAFNFARTHAIEDQLQRVSIPDSPDLQLTETLTLEAWIFPMKIGGIVMLRGDDRGGYDSWQIDLMTDGHISYTFNTADNQGFGINAPIQLNQWQHIAMIFDRGRMSIYVNGILANEKHTDLQPIAVLDPAANPALGIGNAGGKHYNMPFDGLIDEVRIYNRALSETEIRERMKQ